MLHPDRSEITADRNDLSSTTTHSSSLMSLLTAKTPDTQHLKRLYRFRSRKRPGDPQDDVFQRGITTSLKIVTVSLRVFSSSADAQRKHRISCCMRQFAHTHANLISTKTPPRKQRGGHPNDVFQRMSYINPPPHNKNLYNQCGVSAPTSNHTRPDLRCFREPPAAALASSVPPYPFCSPPTPLPSTTPAPPQCA